MNYPEFSEQNRSLLKKYLTEEKFGLLKTRKTKSGFTFFHAIRSGLDNQDSSIGIYAGDAESYKVFEEIFDPIIVDYHSFNPDGFHISDFSLPQNFENPDPDNRYIISTRIRVARNVDGFPFTPFIDGKSRKELELKIVHTLGLPEFADNDLTGSYIPIRKIFKSGKILRDEKYVFFDKGDKFQDSAGINRDWPESRGVFISNGGNLFVWVNEEDHLRIISMEKGGKLSEAFGRMSILLSCFERNISFSFDSRLGYLTSCPSNLGTGMRAGVHIRLPELYKKKELLSGLADSFHLQIRGTKGENTKVEKAVFDISNGKRLGITENQCIQNLQAGLAAIIDMENRLEIGAGCCNR